MSSQVFPTRKSQNLLTNAEAINLWSTTLEAGTSVSANATAAPDGTTTADRIDYVGGGTAGGIRVYQSSGSAIAGQLYTSSIYLKANTGASRLGLYNNAVGTAVAPITLTSSWQRFSISGTCDGSGPIQVQVRSYPGENLAFSVYAWGGNVTVGGLEPYGASVGDNTLTQYVVPESLTKTPVRRTIIQTADSGQEYRVSRGAVRYRYGMELNGLDSTARDTLASFFDTHGGRWDRFYLEDPWSGSLTYVRFDQDELEFSPMAAGLWRVSLSFISVI